MKFYYIDDSYFVESSFLVKLRNRFLQLCKRQPVDIIFVSGNVEETQAFGDFLSFCRELEIQVLVSPSAFDIDGVKGVLSSVSLNLEGFSIMQCYSGSVWYGDYETMEIDRLYLECFLSFEEEAFVNELSDEIEHVLKDLIQKKGKSKNNQYN